MFLRRVAGEAVPIIPVFTRDPLQIREILDEKDNSLHRTGNASGADVSRDVLHRKCVEEWVHKKFTKNVDTSMGRGLNTSQNGGL
jgi:hypothetical protein